MLEMGLDYLVDDNALTINFNIQLGEACHGLGDEKKKDFYFSKANQLLKKIKMNKFLALLAVLVLLFSCKSKAIVTKATAQSRI
jgi:ACR3 family arsenite efflux pump ArsB